MACVDYSSGGLSGSLWGSAGWAGRLMGAVDVCLSILSLEAHYYDVFGWHVCSWVLIGWQTKPTWNPVLLTVYYSNIFHIPYEGTIHTTETNVHRSIEKKIHHRTKVKSSDIWPSRYRNKEKSTNHKRATICTCRSSHDPSERHRRCAHGGIGGRVFSTSNGIYLAISQLTSKEHASTPQLGDWWWLLGGSLESVRGSSLDGDMARPRRRIQGLNHTWRCSLKRVC